ncbi:MAG TPA: RNA methyltransferase [Flavisolibacter sp.]|nr:RNA methyltransferase [Flavisolibacter sp.]
MLSKKVLKDIQSLALKKRREETSLFVAEGPKIVAELLQVAPHLVEAIYATESWILTNATNLDVTEISEVELEKISQLKTPNQVLAIVRQFEISVPAAAEFTLYLDVIQDPGNFGTIIRIADWFGIKQVVCSRGCADLYNSKVVQSTMASIARVAVFYDDDETWLRVQNEVIYAAALDGKPLPVFPKTEKGILIIGNESAGIRKEFLTLASQKVTIPRRGEAESLNAAVATGIILSHFLS